MIHEGRLSIACAHLSTSYTRAPHATPAPATVLVTETPVLTFSMVRQIHIFLIVRAGGCRRRPLPSWGGGNGHRSLG